MVPEIRKFARRVYELFYMLQADALGDAEIMRSDAIESLNHNIQVQRAKVRERLLAKPEKTIDLEIADSYPDRGKVRKREVMGMIEQMHEEGKIYEQYVYDTLLPPNRRSGSKIREHANEQFDLDMDQGHMVLLELLQSHRADVYEILFRTTYFGQTFPESWKIEYKGLSLADFVADRIREVGKKRARFWLKNVIELLPNPTHDRRKRLVNIKLDNISTLEFLEFLSDTYGKSRVAEEAPSLAEKFKERNTGRSPDVIDDLWDNKFWAFSEDMSQARFFETLFHQHGAEEGLVRSLQIKDWFRERSGELETDVRNALFFGCAWLLEGQAKWEWIKGPMADGSIEKSTHPLYAYYTYYTDLQEVIDKFPREGTAWEESWLRSFKELVEEFASESGVDVSEALKSKHIQNKYGTLMTTDYPKTSTMMAIHLVNRLIETGFSKRRTTAAETLVDLATLYDVRLPAHLRSLSFPRLS